MDETWVSVRNSRGFYEVSADGLIRASTDIVYNRGSRWGKKGDIKHCQGDILKYQKGEYYQVSLYMPDENPQTYRLPPYVHTLVYTSFHNIDKPEGLVIDHIDGNKHNNRIANLQLITQQENSVKSYINDESSRWSNRKSSVIRGDGTFYKNIKEACIDNSVSNAALISAIHRGGICGGYTWRYEDEDKQSMIDNKIAIRERRKKGRHTNLSNLVRCIDTFEIKTVSEFAREYDCGTEVLYNALDYNDGYSKYLHKTFQFV